MKFASWHWLLLLILLLPACVLFLRWGMRRRREMLDRIISPRLHDSLLRSVDYARRRFKYFLFLAGLALVMIALARPMLGQRQVRVELPGIDYFIALDVSRSMLAEDAGTTNRLTAAKRALSRLLARPSGDRVGLVVFAGDAFLVSPITQDHGSIDRTIMAMSTISVSKPGTDIAAAIKLAAKSFEAKQEGGKAILIVSDGEELQGDAIVAAREAASQKIAVFTVGVGSPAGARLPDRSSGQLQWAKNEFGTDVVSRLNERVLQQIATAGRGRYAHIGPEGEGVIEVYERGMKLLPKGTHIRQSQDQLEFFQLPLALGLICLFWEMLVNERKRR